MGTRIALGFLALKPTGTSMKAYLINYSPLYDAGGGLSQSPSSGRSVSAASAGDALVEFAKQMASEKPESSLVIDIDDFEIEQSHVNELKTLGVKFDHNAQPPDIQVTSVELPPLMAE